MASPPRSPTDKWYVPLPTPLHYDVPGAKAKMEPDTRMVKCVLRSYTECPAVIPAACICSGMPRENYEAAYRRKYGNDDE